MEMDFGLSTLILDDRSFNGRKVMMRHELMPPRGTYVFPDPMDWMIEQGDGTLKITGQVEEEKRKAIISMIKQESLKNPDFQIHIG